MATTLTRPLYVRPDTLLPELFRLEPRTRAVFDRYGLRGCGGASGPHESVRFFAETHGVPEAVLLREIGDALSRSETPPALEEKPEGEATSATIYRRFFTAAIAIALTAGATWGAWILWRIGAAGSITGLSIHEVNAHGHAQIFGWVGLFIMGFGYQAFPRMWHADLVGTRWAVASFGLMLAGIVLRTAGTGAISLSTWALPAAMLGGGFETAAITIFAVAIGATWIRAGKPLDPGIGFLLAGLAWFVAQAVFSMWHSWLTLDPGSSGELIAHVATFQPPLRDLQIHGLALFMILGVSLRMVPALFGTPRTPPLRAWAALGLLTAAVLAEVVLFLIYRASGDRRLAAGLIVPWATLALGVALVVLPWKLWARPGTDGARDRSFKFVRSAYLWLGVSLLMLLLVPVYQWLSGTTFSHAYHGATRHAITVGFISAMILGMAAKVVPTLNGVDPRKLTALWGPFVLLNTGCFLRVALQVLTDFHPAFFSLIGVSGTLEVSAIGWWGAGLVTIMRRGRLEAAGVDPLQAMPPRIEGTHRVADVLSWFPATEGVFVRYGLTAIRNPLLRRTIARRVTVSEACGLRSLDADTFIADLNAARLESAPDPRRDVP